MFNQPVVETVTGGVTESSGMLLHLKSYLPVLQFTQASIKCCYSHLDVQKVRGCDLFEVTH